MVTGLPADRANSFAAAIIETDLRGECTILAQIYTQTFKNHFLVPALHIRTVPRKPAVVAADEEVPELETKTTKPGRVRKGNSFACA